MSRPAVSVIIPVYNGERYIAECVSSVQNQSLTDLEIIIIDDGSTDNTAAICNRLAQKDMRIRIIHKQNEGAGFARNSGLEAVRGTFVAFADADDFLEPKMLETLYKAGISYAADFVMCGAKHIGGIVFGGSNQAVEEKYCFSETQVFCGDAQIKQLLLGTVGADFNEREDSRYGYALWKNLYRSDIIREHRLRFVSERVYASEDMLFLVDYILHCKKAVGIPGAYYCYRRNENSVSKSYSPQRFLSAKRQMHAVADKLQVYIPKREYTPYCARQFQAYTRVIIAQEIMHAKNNQQSGKILRSNLRGILNDSALKSALRGCAFLRLPPKQAIFALCMKLRSVCLLKLLVIFREKAQR